MAEITKVALKVDNNSSFPNNNAGAITPSILRAFNTNMIDSLVDEIGYTADSSSWNQQIDSLEQFTASAAGLSTGSLLVTASFNNGTRDLTFTKGDTTTFAVNIPDVSGSTINTGSFVTTSSFNAYTASQSTASLVTSITNLNTFTSSQLTINTAIGASTSSLNTFTGSQTTKNSTLATYTASVDTKFTAVGASTSSLNTFTGSQITKNSTLATYTASVDTKFTAVGASTSSLNTATASLFTSASLGLTTASFSGNTLTFTKGNGTTFGINIPDVSGSTINTGSFATTGSNTFYGNQIISGNVLPLVNGQGDLGSDTFKWNSVTVNGQLKGSSINTSGRGLVGTLRLSDESFPLGFLGDREMIGNGSGANTRMYYATSSTDTNGLREFAYVPSGSPTTPNMNILSASFASTIAGITTGTGFATTGSNVFVGNQTITGSLFISGNINMVNGADIVTHHVRAQGSNGLELQTSAGTIIVAMGQGGGTQAGFVGAVTANSISASTINGLGDPLAFSTSVDSRLDGLEGVSGSFVTTASFNSYTSSTDNRLTNIETTTASLLIETSNLETFSSSALISLSNLNTATASLFTSASLSLTTASFAGNTLTFTKGNGTTFGVVIPDVSGSTINTGSFATTGSNSFIGNQTITGSLILSSSAAIELQVIGNSVFTGSAFGNVVSMSIASATASMNLNTGNYFTLSIPTGTTRISPSNIQAGTSATLVITTASGSLVTFDSSVKQPSGSAYVPTSGSTDILSFVSVNSSSLFVVATKNMI